MLDIDYTKYLSLDNGHGLLINRSDAKILERYGFDYLKYGDLFSLIFDIDNYLNDQVDADDLEEVLIRVSEMYYYSKIKK